MSRKWFVCLCAVLGIVLSSVVASLFEPAAAVAASPDAPVNVSPSDGARDVSLTPMLRSSNFSDHDLFDRHEASQWQMTTSYGDYSDPVFDSRRDRSNLTSIAIPSSTLNYSTTYYWHVRHQDNHKHWSGWSPKTSFTTVSSPSDTTAPEAVTDLAPTSATANSATLIWTAPGDDGGMGTASTYDLRYFTASITNTNWGSASQCSGEPTPNAAGSAETFTVTGLSPDTPYYFAMKTADEVPKWSGISNVASKKTNTLPPIVATSAAASVGSTSATLNGYLTSLGTAASVQISFEWGQTTSYANTTAPQTMTGLGAFSSVVDNLAPGTIYLFRAKATGNGTTYGDRLAFTAPASFTGTTVTTSAATGTGTSSAMLNGRLSSLGTASSVTVSFQWGTTTSYGHDTSAQSIPATGVFGAHLTGLTARTKYHFRTKAVGHGSPVYGEDMIFTTASVPDVTLVISQVEASDIAASGATAIWTTNQAASSRVQYGLTEEYGSSSVEIRDLTTSHSVHLSDLKSGKTYHYRVISKDAAGNEAVSRDATLTTIVRSGGIPKWACLLICYVAVGVLATAGFRICPRKWLYLQS